LKCAENEKSLIVSILKSDFTDLFTYSIEIENNKVLNQIDAEYKKLIEDEAKQRKFYNLKKVFLNI